MKWCRRCGQVRVAPRRMYCDPCRRKQDLERYSRYKQKRRNGESRVPIEESLVAISQDCLGPAYEDCSMCPCKECVMRVEDCGSRAV